MQTQMACFILMLLLFMSPPLIGSGGVTFFHQLFGRPVICLLTAILCDVISLSLVKPVKNIHHVSGHC